MDTLSDGQIKLLRLRGRGEMVLQVDAEGEPLWDEEPDFVPD